MLQHTTTYCNATHSFDDALYATMNTLHHVATRCSMWQHAVVLCSTLKRTAAYCNGTHCNRTHCKVLPHYTLISQRPISAATIMQHATTYCESLQHTATQHILFDDAFCHNFKCYTPNPLSLLSRDSFRFKRVRGVLQCVAVCCSVL